MSTPQLERLRAHCHQLRLYQIENELTARLEQATKKASRAFWDGLSLEASLPK